MEKLLFVSPDMSYKQEILNYKQEFVDNGDSMDGSAGLMQNDTVEVWLNFLEKNSKADSVSDNIVPSSTYLVIRERDSYLIGMVDIRHRLNDALLKSGGHIGYSVRKSQRNRGYAKNILSMCFDICRKLNIHKILLTCSKENIASQRTIIANGGILENTIQCGEIEKMRYWIEI